MKNSIRIKYFFLAIGLFFISSANGQFGLRLKFNQNNYKNWENVLVQRFQIDNRLFSKGYEAGLDYWFRLEKRRVEFMPELAYSFSATTFDNHSIDKFGIGIFSFNFHTHIYALDMEGDCDCPTFSKQGPSINKGLFFHFTPGISYYNATGEAQPILSSMPITNNSAQGLIFKVGGGIGLDLGISDILTVTPIVSYYFYGPMTWKKLAVNGLDFVDSKNNLSMLQFSIRLGFRADYNNRRFKR
ncbi:MAG: hypothetical protein IPL55_08640 [Saprospiraceae bacterium]|jgi:hypothetical protein|nr:hypothetical protein [Saprospiraceae bacterium]MBL0027244.1 hypothetical protein [Saprospiraceae bacterium]